MAINKKAVDELIIKCERIKRDQARKVIADEVGKSAHMITDAEVSAFVVGCAFALKGVKRLI
ncbi:MAG: hypothetical protein ACTSPD_09910 [Promethearchaeota archaeon]